MGVGFWGFWVLKMVRRILGVGYFLKEAFYVYWFGIGLFCFSGKFSIVYLSLKINVS